MAHIEVTKKDCVVAYINASSQIKDRDINILADYVKDLSTKELASKYELSRNRIAQILNKYIRKGKWRLAESYHLFTTDVIITDANGIHY